MRLIDADRFKVMVRLSFEELAKYPAMDNETLHMMTALDMLCDMIDDAPTVGISKEGKIDYIISLDAGSKYCPYCGAEMEEEE